MEGVISVSEPFLEPAAVGASLLRTLTRLPDLSLPSSELLRPSAIFKLPRLSASLSRLIFSFLRATALLERFIRWSRAISLSRCAMVGGLVLASKLPASGETGGHRGARVYKTIGACEPGGYPARCVLCPWA